MSAWIVCPRPNPSARLRLFCFPSAGGAASMFRTWVDALPRDIELSAIQLPGREGRFKEPPFSRLSPVVRALADDLRPRFDKPFAFFGHSVGALLGFELARHLLREERPGPVCLFVSARRAPQIEERDPPIRDLPDAEFLAEARRRYNGIPEEALRDPELTQLLLPTLRADLAIHEAYAYEEGELLNCPISSFGGLEDPIVTPTDLAAWRDQTCHSFKLRMLPGDHFFLLRSRAPLLRALADDLAHFSIEKNSRSVA